MQLTIEIDDELYDLLSADARAVRLLSAEECAVEMIKNGYKWQPQQPAPPTSHDGDLRHLTHDQLQDEAMRLRRQLVLANAQIDARPAMPQADLEPVPDGTYAIGLYELHVSGKSMSIPTEYGSLPVELPDGWVLMRPTTEAQEATPTATNPA